MENVTTATTESRVSHPRIHLVTVVLRRAGEMFIDGLKFVGAGTVDPMICSAYWIGSSPSVRGANK